MIFQDLCIKIESTILEKVNSLYYSGRDNDYYYRLNISNDRFTYVSQYLKRIGFTNLYSFVDDIEYYYRVSPDNTATLVYIASIDTTTEQTEVIIYSTECDIATLYYNTIKNLNEKPLNENIDAFIDNDMR